MITEEIQPSSKWVERTFRFEVTVDNFPTIIARLQNAPIRIKLLLYDADPARLSFRHYNKWSIKENIGHLSDLEELWQGRISDILNNVPVMRPWDVDNKLTHQAGHNEKEFKTLIDNFHKIRNQTTSLLSKLSEEELLKSAIHPRLEIPMQIIELFYFVAEHDDHHIDRISMLSNL